MSAWSNGLGIVSFLCCWVFHLQSPTLRSIIPTCVPNDRIRRIKTRREKETDDGNASDTSGTSFTSGRSQRAHETGTALLGTPALVDHLQCLDCTAQSRRDC